MVSHTGQSDEPSVVQEEAQHDVKRPSLLPAFEPTSSSPSLPVPRKRKYEESFDGRNADLKHYPTPVPTSSTSIIPSSPSQQRSTRPCLQRTASTASERVPLGAVPSVEIPHNGEPLLMGRSSNSSHYQLSACRLISRVHVRATYHAPSEQHEHGRILIECLGWNGVNVHCRGRKLELGKGDTFTSDKPQAEVMLDVQAARVMIRWPAASRKDSVTAYNESNWDETETPDHDRTPPPSSPPQIQLHSPISPSPQNRRDITTSTTFLGLPSASSESNAVEIYEDHTSSDGPADQVEATGSTPTRNSMQAGLPMSFGHEPASSPLSELDEDFSNNNEENDPIIHSFGPFGDNILPRIAGINAASPDRKRHPLQASSSTQQRTASSNLNSNPDIDLGAIRNHVINQLAFGRLHSLPLSTIFANLPVTLTQPSTSANGESSVSFSREQLKTLLYDTACVGEIHREGKDAAGKPLEDEHYYVPEMDADEMRRNAVESGLGKPGLRSVRKQHKQYYWKRPRS